MICRLHPSYKAVRTPTSTKPGCVCAQAYQAARDEEILHYDPWYDDSDYRVLSNKMIVTRKPADCAICFETIPAKTRVRAQTEVYDGKCMTFRFCTLCCDAMSRVTSRTSRCDHGEAMEHRFTLGPTNAAQKRTA